MELSNNKSKVITLEDIRKSGLKDTQTTFTVKDDQDLKFEIIPNIDYWDVKKYNSSGKLEHFFKITKREFYNDLLYKPQRRIALKNKFYSECRKSIHLKDNPNILGGSKAKDYLSLYFEDFIDNLSILLPNIPLSRKPEKTKKEETKKKLIPFKKLKKFALLSAIKKEMVINRPLYRIVGEEKKKNLIFYELFGSTTQYIRPIQTQGSSGSGKSYLSEEILFRLIPEEHFLFITQISDNALARYKEQLSNIDIIYIPEADKVKNIIESLKDLADLGIKKLINVPTEDKRDWDTTLFEIDKKCVLTTTTNPNIDTQFSNRQVIITTNESRELTMKIGDFQDDYYCYIDRYDEMEDNKLWKDQELIKEYYRLLRNEVKIKEFEVIIPFTTQISKLLKVLFVDIRRDKPKFFDFIATITLYNIFNREIFTREKRKYVIATREDVYLGLLHGLSIFQDISLKLDSESSKILMIIEKRILKEMENAEQKKIEFIDNKIMKEIKDIEIFQADLYNYFIKNTKISIHKKTFDRRIKRLASYGYILNETISNRVKIKLRKPFSQLKIDILNNIEELSNFLDNCESDYNERLEESNKNTRLEKNNLNIDDFNYDN